MRKKLMKKLNSDGMYTPCNKQCDNKSMSGFCLSTGGCINPKHNKPTIDIGKLHLYDADTGDNIFESIDFKNTDGDVHKTIESSLSANKNNEASDSPMMRYPYGAYLTQEYIAAEVGPISESNNASLKSIIDSNVSGLPKRSIDGTIIGENDDIK